MKGKTSSAVKNFNPSFKKAGDLDEVVDIEGTAAHPLDKPEDSMPRIPQAINMKRGMHAHSISISTTGYKGTADEFCEPSMSLYQHSGDITSKKGKKKRTYSADRTSAFYLVSKRSTTL